MNLKLIKEKNIVLAALVACMCIVKVLFFNKAYAEELTGCSSTEIVDEMGMGWNLGKTFDATGGNSSDIYSHEQSWGNPIVSKELIDAVKAAGFNTIRIPITWNRELSDDGAYTINEAFLARVKEVVDYAYENDMYVIINVHHEEWVNDPKLTENYVEIGNQLAAVWLQIADYFADYDQHLIFEGMNEPRMAGTDLEWGGNQAGYEAVNYLTQVFVNAVRSSDKGYNQERCLMIPGYAASSSSSVMSAISLPTIDGKTVENLIVSVHCYSPYNFCLSDSQKDFNPDSAEHTGEIDSIFESIKTIFLDNGIPVIIGETSATDKGNTEARENWAEYMGSKSAAYGVPIVIWDNGNYATSGGECHAYMNRYTNEVNYTTVVEALFTGYSNTEFGSARGESSGSTESLIDGSVIWSNAEGLTSTGLWDSSFIGMGSNQSWYVDGREIAVVFSGNGEPKVILDSQEKNVWWIQVDPDRITTSGDKKVAYFGYNTLLTAMNNNGVDGPSQLRNFYVLAANDNITVYEISTVGDAYLATYIANGKVVHIGADMPEDPTYTNMEFAGWYTTKNYLEGTEYTGGELTEDITVYACFDLTLDMAEMKAGFEEIRSQAPAEPDDTPEATPTPKEEENGNKAEVTKPASNDAAKDKVEDTKDDGNMIVPVIIIAVIVIGVVVAAVMKSKKNK
ncbi:MAG: cellulase family glycosylhydrolase [Lachnospiraceae bacterium]|nr:cellulase family glycosylhydrolase [Lachnospiraceae bacterium]